MKLCATVALTLVTTRQCFPFFADMWWMKQATCIGACGAALAVFLVVLTYTPPEKLKALYAPHKKLKALYATTKAIVQGNPRVKLTMFTTFKNKTDKYQTYSNHTPPEKLKAFYTTTKAIVQGNQGVKLTMFTTFKNKADKYQTYRNTLHNWALFIPQIQPLLFTYKTDEKLIKLAKSLGWLVHDVPRLHKNKVPIWKDMYFAAQNHSDSIFYGYFNGDLLFDHGLINTLLTIEQYLDQLNKTLAVGQRTNVPLKGRDLWNISDVTEAAKEGKLFCKCAMDYFILAHNQYVWNQVLDVVIGRPVYDNYLVALALKNNISVIDVTETMLTFHQTGKDGIHAGTMNRDAGFNQGIIGKFDITRGGTNFATFYTKHGQGKEKIELWNRSTKEKVKLSKLSGL